MATAKKRSGYTWVKGSKGRKGHWRKKAKRRTLRGLKGCVTTTTSKPAGVVGVSGLAKVKRKRRKATKRKRTLRGVGAYAVQAERGPGGRRPGGKKLPHFRTGTASAGPTVSGLGKVKRKRRKTAKRRK